MFVKALTLLSNLLFSASLPPVCVDDLTASILVPLAKNSNGVRPIAIGEAFIRIAGKVAMAKVRGLGAEGERQYGVCKQAGLERLLHKLREGMDTKLIASVLSLDFKNAFNSVSRAHIAREVAKVLPRLSRFFHLAYSRPAKFFLRRRGAPPRRPSFTGRRAAGRPSWLTLLRHCHCRGSKSPALAGDLPLYSSFLSYLPLSRFSLASSRYDGNRRGHAHFAGARRRSSGLAAF